MQHPVRTLFSLLLAGALSLTLAACGGSPSGSGQSELTAQNTLISGSESASGSDTEGQTIVLTDNVGRQVELPSPVTRCAVALRYTNELIRACGAIDRVVAVDLNTAQDREYRGMFDPDAVIGKNQRELDYEAIVALDPQVLILPDNGAYEEAIAQLEPFGIPVFVLSGYDTDHFASQCETIGQMFGVQEQADTFCRYFTEKLAYIDRQLEGVAPRTYYFEGNEDYSTILPGDTFYRMLELAHGQNIFADDAAGISAAEVDPEAILQRDPQVIIKCITPDAARAGTGLYEPPTREDFVSSYQSLISRPGFGELTAVKNSDVYYMTQFGHGGACKLVGTMYVAKWLYPDLLPELDPDEVYRAWMEDFQGFRAVEGHFYTAAALQE